MKLNRYIDHTNLKPDATQENIATLCQEAKQYEFMSVCVQPTWVSYATEQLKDSIVKVCTVIGFPHGANDPRVKSFETQQAIENGADEVDMVINIGAVKSGNWALVKEDIQGVVDVAKEHHVVSKVILETCLLTDEEKIKVCQICKEVGADFVKTSTGFSTGGANVHDIALMRESVGQDLGVKASGGVRSKEDALAMIEAGANRLGASSGVAICQGLVSQEEY
ncbi:MULTISPECIES: deoxyribose-phosphate aldolase [unclassified Granulicatella]|uniref:deoxyribose-phosphate aldolase n=1 Tax=unclassified Granulicatella TaxID=2630493 RepID=UPI001074571B|nr:MULTISPECIES: deoxyribose-phosphate aldolase [unclassified Granulicatella]MBF0779496.1 deoxyribose-phosphate aldolase [Granulicatella sp. 19428wC4_WM01]TFU96462.1 deoxyribose-phosphate aldolase [Granulicatella sp. WM01]